MKNLLIILTLFSNLALAQSGVKVFLIFDNSDLAFADVQRKVNFLIDNVNCKKVNFEIIHFSNSIEIDNSWSRKKNIVQYKPIKTTCEFNICTYLTSILSLMKTSESSLFFTDKSFECKLEIKTTQLPNKDESTISERLTVELSRIKSSNSNQNLIFVFSSDKKPKPPTINFSKSILSVREGESIQLRPELDGAIQSYSWSPSTELSCTDCPNPTILAKESRTYTLTIKDSSGCFTVSKSIDINVERSCLCNSELGKIEILFGKLPIRKYEKRNPSALAEWDWRVISNQSGLYVFDLITNAICAKKFRLLVKGSLGQVIYDEIYFAEDVDKRSNNPNHKEYPNNFVFRVDLSDYHLIKIIEDVENNPFFMIEIIPFDDDDYECENRKYTSPKIRPTKCH